MVASIGQAAAAEYYLECQRSYRPADAWFVPGEEPDGAWCNPSGLFDIADGSRVETPDWLALYGGFSPGGGARLTRNSGGASRSAGIDVTCSADKTISALWAVADPGLREGIERAHAAAARAALEEIVFRHCGYTRVRKRDGEIRVVPARPIAAMFPHGSSRAGDPQLHVHCVILNVARTEADGRFRAVHQYPVYLWRKAAGSAYRNALAWRLREDLGLPVERYGERGEFTRVAGVPGGLVKRWSKRRETLEKQAAAMGYAVKGNAARLAAANLAGRPRKDRHDIECRHERWRNEAADAAGIAESVAEAGRRSIAPRLPDGLDELPLELVRETASFRLPELVERVENATAGALDRAGVRACLERALERDDLVLLDGPKKSADARAGLAHTKVWSVPTEIRMTAGGGRDGAAREGERAAAGERAEGAALLADRGYESIAAAGDWKAAKAPGTGMRPVTIDRPLELGRKTAVRVDGTLTERGARYMAEPAKRTGATILPAGGARRNGQGGRDVKRLSELLPAAGGAVGARETPGNLHLGRDLEDAMKSLGGDWDRFRRSGGTAMVLARTRAEAQALSFLLRERALDGRGVSAVARVAGGGRRRTALLEIAPGDLVRFGAPHGGLKLPAGTVVAVEEVEAASGSVLIRGRAGEGRDVEFSPEEIADSWGNVRLDHSYAQTISSAWGEAVDRVFLFADDKLTASMIGRAEALQRDGLDIYVDREQLPAGDAANYLAERWRRPSPPAGPVEILANGGGGPAERNAARFPERPEERGARERPTDPDGRGAADWLAANGSVWGRDMARAVRRAASELRERGGGGVPGNRQEPRERTAAGRAPSGTGGDVALRATPHPRELSAALAGRAEEICRAYLPGGRRTGNYWQAGSVAGERGRSLYVHLAGGRRGRWVDEATGEKGDLLDLIRAARGHSRMIDAMREAASIIGGSAPEPREAVAPAAPATNPRRLENFLRSARGVGGDTPAARYLERRGLRPEGELKFHPSVRVQVDGEARRLPALLAPVRTPDGRLEAVQRIFVREDGSPAEFEGRKRHTGSPRQGAVWFGDPRAARRVALCEGVEDALAVLRVLTLEEKRGIAVAASLSAGRLARVEMPDAVREVVLVQDRDAAGERAWEALGTRFAGSGVAVSRALPEGKDANEDLLERGPEALRAALAPLTEGAPQLQEAAGRGAAGRQVALADLRMEMEKIGAAGLRLVDDLAAGGEASRRIVEDALTGEFRGGTVGALRELGAIADAEWSLLEERSRGRDSLAVPERDEDVRTSAAEAYRRWSDGSAAAGGPLGWLFARIARLVDAVRSAAGGAEAIRDDQAVVPEEPEPAAGGAAADGRTDSATDSFARLNEEWKERTARADAERTHMIYLDGHGEFLGRMKALAESLELDETLRSGIAAGVKYLEAGEDARRYVEDWRAAMAKCEARREILERARELSGVASVTEVASYGEWREESEALAISGKTMLADEAAFGVHLRRRPAGESGVESAVEAASAHHRLDDGFDRTARKGGGGRQSGDFRAGQGDDFAGGRNEVAGGDVRSAPAEAERDERESVRSGETGEKASGESRGGLSL